MKDAFDPELVERAQNGDDQARERLMTALSTLFRRFFISRLGPREEVGDLVQNSLIRIHTSLHALQRTDRLKSFAMKAAVFELHDFYRGRYSPKESRFDPDLPTPGVTQPEKTGLQVDLERALETLTPKAQRIIELREMGYPYKDIADMLDTTEAAIKMQVKRAFERLRDHLTLILVVLMPALTAFTC